MMLKPKDFYAADNLRFRKAYIRERLAALKLEREALVHERDMIDEAIKRQPSDAQGDSAASQH